MQERWIVLCETGEEYCGNHSNVEGKAFGVDCLSDRQIFRWHKAFAEGREDVNDENRAGRPSTSSSDDNVKRVRDLLNTDHHLSVRVISKTLDITKTIVHEIVSESLGMRKAGITVVPQPPNSHDVAPPAFSVSAPQNPNERTEFWVGEKHSEGLHRRFKADSGKRLPCGF
ncbi:hypothetical protein NQ318_017047 [Aromia moschata]|uniref:Mos1 transposase HTH domain-containing protein n=1 Tax=Aromia moschata TaxID=1265417 RepID=A0AAV8Y9Z6_9CUCU|nr:hypothetical protein NQ318_017047 [Aromia moschata]